MASRSTPITILIKTDDCLKERKDYGVTVRYFFVCPVASAMAVSLIGNAVTIHNSELAAD
jgi:hypothetical protein